MLETQSLLAAGAGARAADTLVPLSLACVHDPEAQRQDGGLRSDLGRGGASPFRKSSRWSASGAALCLALGPAGGLDPGSAPPSAVTLGTFPVSLGLSVLKTRVEISASPGPGESGRDKSLAPRLCDSQRLLLISVHNNDEYRERERASIQGVDQAGRVPSPSLLGAVSRQGEMEKAGAQRLLWERPALFCVSEERGGRILRLRGPFLEGAGLAAKCFLPWRQPHSCQEKTAVWLPFKEGSPQSCGYKGRIRQKTGMPRQVLSGGVDWLPKPGFLAV